MKELITKKKITESKRLAFLPKHVGHLCAIFQDRIFATAEAHCKEYDGGYWEFWELSNGGFYLSWDEDKKLLNVANPLNYFEGKMSVDAFSLGVNLMALNHLSWAHKGKSECRSLVDKFYLLKDYALEHPESGEILRFID